MRLLRAAFSLSVGIFIWACVGGVVCAIAFQGRLPFATDPLSEARQRAARGDLPGALRQYQVAVRIEPTDMRARAELGELLGRAGRYDEALDVLHDALDVKQDARVFTGIGDVLSAKRQYRLAAAAYQEAVRMKPDQPQLRQRLERALREDAKK